MQCNEACGALAQTGMIAIGFALGIALAAWQIRREKRAAQRAWEARKAAVRARYFSAQQLRFDLPLFSTLDDELAGRNPYQPGALGPCDLVAPAPPTGPGAPPQPPRPAS